MNAEPCSIVFHFDCAIAGTAMKAKTTAHFMVMSVVQMGRVDALRRFLRPLCQDLDGVSRADDAERIARIAHALHPRRSPALELLLGFHLLGSWLDKVGNLSRTALNTGISEGELRK